MKTPLILATLGLLAALGAPPASAASQSAPSCMWNHDVVQDQYVSYNGFTDATVGVVFVDGSPLCQVWIVCWGTWFYCTIPPLP